MAHAGPTAEPPPADDSQGTAGEPDAMGALAPRRVLRDGAGTRTELARSDTTGARFVVKRIEPEATDPDFVETLERLSEAPGAGSTAPTVVERTSDAVVVVRPYVPGPTLAQLVEDGPLDLLDALVVCRRLAEHLAVMHAAGVLHSNLKPSNVAVSGGRAEETHLMDAGQARMGVGASEHREDLAHAARYVAPEQAGVLDHPLGAWSDLYALGSLLFEAITGRPLVRGDDLGEVLRQQISTPVPDIRTLGHRVPMAVTAILDRLLAKDPLERYETAIGVVADLRAIIEGIDAGEDEPEVTIGAHDRRSTLAEPAFVGRHDELQTLTSATDRSEDDAPGLVVVEARSGGGKTWTLDELDRRATCRGWWVLRGQGVEEVAERPFQVLGGVVDGIRARAVADPHLAAGLREALGGDREHVVDALPELADVLDVERAGTEAPEAFGERRTLRALRRLLEALGSVDEPALVVLDDCQWADEQTVKLLVHFARHRHEQRAPLVVVLSFRSEEVGPDNLLRSARPDVTVELAPFDRDDVEKLALTIAGPTPTDAVDLMLELSEGNPFMATEVLRGIVESGALVPRNGRWVTDSAKLVHAQSSRHAAELIGHRLELLPDDAVRLLCAGAVLGREFDVAVAAELAGQDPDAASEYAAMARERRILWTARPAGRVVFVHDKLRETLLARLTDDERREFHRRVALRIEQDRAVAPFDLAYHYDAAGEHDLALPFALEAARRARGQNALGVAERYYMIAERGTRDRSDTERLQVVEGLGDVLMLRGEYDGSQSWFNEAAELAGDATARAEVQAKLGELAFKRGDMEASAQELEAGLRILGRRVPGNSFVAFFMLLWEVLVQTFHSLFPRALLHRRPRGGADEEFVAIRIYSRLAHTYWFASGMVPCGWAHLREMNLAEKYEPTAELAQAYSEHAPVMTMVPWYSRGVDYSKRSLGIRRRLGDRWGEGQSLHFMGVVLYASSRYEECIERCRRAIHLLERTGDRWEVNTARWHIAFAQYRLGRLAEAVETARKVHADGIEIGDAQAAGIGLGAWSKASGGHVPAAVIREQLTAEVKDVHTGAEILMAEAVRLLAEDRPGEAIEVLERARRRVREEGLRQEYVAPIQPWLATAWRRYAASARPWDPGARSRRLRKARRAARRALRTARAYRNNLPHAERELGLVEAMWGRPRTARRHLDRSLAAARDQGAVYEQAQTLVARGDVGSAHGWNDAEVDTSEGLRLTAQTHLGLGDALDPRGAGTGSLGLLSLADRFDTVVESGRDIASGSSQDEVLATVRRVGRTLLRADVSEVHRLDGGDRAAAVPVPDLARRALDESAAVVWTGHDPSIRVRSAMCAPIVVRGEPVAVLYVAHTSVADLFGTEEQRLAEFVAALAGAALENAEGFEALQRAHDRLKELDRLRTRFINTAAHELKTPLTPIKLQLHLLRHARSEGLTDEQRHSIDVLHRNLERLNALVTDVLEAARLQAGRLQVTRGPVDVSEIVDEAAESFRDPFAVEGIRLEVHGAGSAHVRVDSRRIAQVMYNLLGNAFDFTPSGGRVAIEVSVEGGEAVVRVSDTGPGVPASELDELFQPFAEVGEPAGHDRASTGLGLFISRGIIEEHGGRIWYEPADGGGSTFAFALPLVREEE